MKEYVALISVMAKDEISFKKKINDEFELEWWKEIGDFENG